MDSNTINGPEVPNEQSKHIRQLKIDQATPGWSGRIKKSKDKVYDPIIDDVCKLEYQCDLALAIYDMYGLDYKYGVDYTSPFTDNDEANSFSLDEAVQAFSDKSIDAELFMGAEVIKGDRRGCGWGRLVNFICIMNNIHSDNYKEAVNIVTQYANALKQEGLPNKYK